MNVMKIPEFDLLLKDESHLVITESLHRKINSNNFKHIPHRHPFFSIEIMCRGRANQYVNGEYYKCSAGSVFLFSPFDEHMFEFVEDNDFFLQCLYFGEDVLSREVLDALDIDCTPFAARLSQKELDIIQNDFDILKREYAGNSPFRKTLLRSIANKIIITILRSSQPHRHEIKNTVHGALSYIRRHFRENLSLNEIAESFCVTPNHFCKYFKKYTGTTFKNYINSLRCDFALSLIQTTKKSITEICFESGFSSPSYFSKIFAQKYGKPPNSFR